MNKQLTHMIQCCQIKDFQILREINFCNFKLSKTAILNIFWILKMAKLKFRTKKSVKFTKVSFWTILSSIFGQIWNFGIQKWFKFFKIIIFLLLKKWQKWRFLPFSGLQILKFSNILHLKIVDFSQVEKWFLDFQRYFFKNFFRIFFKKLATLQFTPHMFDMNECSCDSMHAPETFKMWS